MWSLAFGDFFCCRYSTFLSQLLGNREKKGKRGKKEHLTLLSNQLSHHWCYKLERASTAPAFALASCRLGRKELLLSYWLLLWTSFSLTETSPEVRAPQDWPSGRNRYLASFGVVLVIVKVVHLCIHYVYKSTKFCQILQTGLATWNWYYFSPDLVLTKGVLATSDTWYMNPYTSVFLVSLLFLKGLIQAFSKVHLCITIKQTIMQSMTEKEKNGTRKEGGKYPAC